MEEMLSRRNKGMVQTSVILVLIICIGYGFYMYELLQNRMELRNAQLKRQIMHNEEQSSQMQAAYEDKASLEKNIKNLKNDCEQQKRQKEELIQGMLVEHQDKNGALVEANKKLEADKARLMEEYKQAKSSYESVHKDHESLKIKHSESMKAFSEDVNRAHEDLQNCEAEKRAFQTQQAAAATYLQSVKTDYQNILTVLKSIPRDAVNFNHPIFKDTSDSDKRYITGLLGESREDLVQVQKHEAIAPQADNQAPVGKNTQDKEEVKEQDLNLKKQKSDIVRKHAEEEGQIEKENIDQGPVGGQIRESDINNEAPVPHQDETNNEKVDQSPPVDNVHPVEQNAGVGNPLGQDQKQDTNVRAEDLNAEMNNNAVQDPDVPKRNDGDGMHEMDADDPSKDLGGPIGDDVVHDLGDKDDGDGIHEIDEEHEDAREEAEEDVDSKRNEMDQAGEADDPAENDELQIEDDENDIHEAIVNGEEGIEEKENVQVVLPPAARVSNEELEVAVNAPPDQKRVDAGGKTRNQDGDYHGNVYEHENYDKDSLNVDDNRIDQEKPHDYYQDEKESEEEKEGRIFRNNNRKRLDRNFEVLNNANNQIPAAAKLNVVHHDRNL